MSAEVLFLSSFRTANLMGETQCLPSAHSPQLYCRCSQSPWGEDREIPVPMVK